MLKPEFAELSPRSIAWQKETIKSTAMHLQGVIDRAAAALEAIQDACVQVHDTTRCEICGFRINSVLGAGAAALGPLQDRLAAQDARLAKIEEMLCLAAQDARLAKIAEMLCPTAKPPAGEVPAPMPPVNNSELPAPAEPDQEAPLPVGTSLKVLLAHKLTTPGEFEKRTKSYDTRFPLMAISAMLPSKDEVKGKSWSWTSTELGFHDPLLATGLAEIRDQVILPQRPAPLPSLVPVANPLAFDAGHRLVGLADDSMRILTETLTLLADDSKELPSLGHFFDASLPSKLAQVLNLGGPSARALGQVGHGIERGHRGVALPVKWTTTSTDGQTSVDFTIHSVKMPLFDGVQYHLHTVTAVCSQLPCRFAYGSAPATIARSRRLFMITKH